MSIIYPQLDGVKINEDRTLPVALLQAIRKAYDYIASGTNGSAATTPGTGGGGGGGATPPPPSDAIGPVTGFTSVGEIGVRYAGDQDRLVHLTIGFIPILPVPQSVTYFVSADVGATWVWIGSSRMLTVGQQLVVDRLAPATTTQWQMAAVAGNWGGTPTPMLDSKLGIAYPGVVRSVLFTVAGLATPPGAQGITATIGSQSNVITADGLTQYGVIPGLTYTDPTSGSDFFVRITVQIYSATGPLAAEQAYGGTQITGPGDSHLEHALLITYVPGLTLVRYRFYVANRNSQGAGDFTDPTTNTLQMVKFNGNPVLANQYDVPITIPPFNPIDSTVAFNVTSVTASEVGPKYQDTNQGLHTSVGIVPVIDHDYSSPRTVTIWLDFGTGTPVWQGWYALTVPNQVVRIGDSTLGTDGVRKSGDIWVPANTTQGNWICYCGGGKIDKGINPTPYATVHFTVTPVTACLPNGITNAQFVNDPTTNNPITYSKFDPGIWYWGYYELTFQPPSLAQDPNYWFTMVTIQKGATISGVWTPAPDSEGINESPNLLFLGRVHTEINQLPGVSGTQVSILQKFGPKPANWVIPVLQNLDFTSNPYRDFRFWLYNVSRLGTDTSGSGGAGTYTLQTTCWPGSADHATLTPQPQAASLDIRAANPATITAPLTGGNGQPLTIPPYTGPGTGIGSGYLGPQSVQAINMAQNSITAANQALADSSVVDPKIVTVGINKVTYGVSVFAGDVVLSRGVSLPVIILKNTGIYLFGQADASTGVTGLLSKPYTAIQNNAIGLFQGGTGTAANGGPGTGGSVFLDASSAAITIYSTNGDITKPYFTVNATGLTLVNGVNSFAVNSNAMLFLDTGNSNRIDINSAGVTITHGLQANGTPAANANQVVVLSNALQLILGGVPQVTINNTGITVSNGGTASVVITPSVVAITNGSLVINAPPVTINIDSTNYIKVSTTSGSTSCSINGAAFRVDGSSSRFATMTLGLLDIRDAALNEVSLGAQGLSFSITGGAFVTAIDSNILWRRGVQCTDHVFGNDFGVSGVSVGWPQTIASGSPVPPGGYGPGLAQGTTRTFLTGDGRTAYVNGGLIVNVV